MDTKGIGAIDGFHDTLLVIVIKCVHEMQEVRVMESIASITRDEEFHLDNLNISSV